MVLMCESNLLFTQLFFNQANTTQLAERGQRLEQRKTLSVAQSVRWTSANLYFTVSSLHEGEAPEYRQTFFDGKFKKAKRSASFLSTFCENLICRTL